MPDHGALEDLAAVREALEAAIEREDHGRAFALGMLYVGDCVLALGEMHDHADPLAPARGRAGGLDTLFDAFAASPQGRSARAALGLAPHEAMTDDEAAEALRLADEHDRDLRDRDEVAPDVPTDLEPVGDRHPQIPEVAWRQLDADQKRQVDDLVERILKSGRAAVEARTPTDRDTYGEQADRLVAELRDEWGIELLAEEAVDAEEASALAGDGEVPAPVTALNAHDLSRDDLRRRARFLRARTGLPLEAARARDVELALIRMVAGARAGEAGGDA